MRFNGIERVTRNLFIISLVLGSMSLSAATQDQPAPPTVVVPGESPAQTPSDAINLFDGINTSHWVHPGSDRARWLVEEGILICEPRSGSIYTREKFGDAQIHLEFATASMPDREGQGRSNSGVYIQGRYEVQILDSYENPTYPDGQCGAIYGQYPPLVNVCRPPGRWQTYDIIFHAPRYSDGGKRIVPGRLTVFHNGVLIQDHAELHGSTTAAMLEEGPDPGPLYLQDHGSRVKFRNIWIRRLNQDNAP